MDIIISLGYIYFLFNIVIAKYNIELYLSDNIFF